MKREASSLPFGSDSGEPSHAVSRHPGFLTSGSAPTPAIARRQSSLLNLFPARVLPATAGVVMRPLPNRDEPVAGSEHQCL